MTVFRKGDTVTVLGIVRHDYADEAFPVSIDIPGYYNYISLAPDLLTLTSPVFTPGEKVIYAEDTGWEFVAMDRRLVWIRHADGSERIVPVSSIIRIDRIDPVPAPALIASPEAAE